MKTLQSFISEAKQRPAVFSFGRFNPPTIGHGKLVDKLNKVSKSVNGRSRDLKHVAKNASGSPQMIVAYVKSALRQQPL